MKKIAILLLVGVMFTLSSCNTGDSSQQPNNSNTDTKVYDYGNGVYYFQYTGNNFAEALSLFIGQHDSIELVSMAGDATGGTGHDIGYFVVFKKKN